MARISGKPVTFRRRGKGNTLHATLSLPVKEGGQISSVRVERSTGTASQQQAEAFVKALIVKAYDDLSRPEPAEPAPERTFGEALDAYVRRTGKTLYLLAIFDEIATLPLSSVDQDVVDALAPKLYPGRTPATWNRQVYTPISAILRMAESKTFKPPTIRRPQGHLAPSNFKRPPKDWFARIIPHCSPNLAAFLLFCRLHGRRTSEACRIRPADIDSDTWRVQIHDTKTGQEIVQRLADPIIEQLARYPWRLSRYVFGFSSKSKVYPALRKACAAAGVPYHVPKDTGRHSFATGLLDEGRSLKEVKEAGRWKTIKVPDMIYGHLEHSAVDERARAIGEKWAAENMKTADVVKPDFSAKSTAGK